MGLVGVYRPSVFKLKALFSNFLIRVFLDHELTCDLVPTLFPVYSGVKNHDDHLIDTGIAADESKPALFHRPEFVIICDKAIVVKLVLIEGVLMEEQNLIFWAQLMNRNNIFLCSLYLNIPNDVAFEGCHEEAI